MKTLKKLCDSKYSYRFFGLILILGIIYVISFFAVGNLKNQYETLNSSSVYDRNGIIIHKTINEKGHYSEYLNMYPETVKSLVITKEDRFFKWHPGFNPISIVRASLHKIKGGSLSGASTITQQVTKILLGNEQDRSVSHKLSELFYAIALEIHLTKDEILTMYLNTAFLGNQAQGFNQASLLYFDTPIIELPKEDLVRLIATLSNPSNNNPWKKDNQYFTESIGTKLAVEISSSSPSLLPSNSFNDTTSFELSSLQFECLGSCTTTLDAELTKKLRKELQINIEQFSDLGVTHGAIVIIHAPTNELLAMVGSPNPQSSAEGNKINMAIAPRPIGSTIKPFIYAKGFERGLRPYTKVTDREYKYPVITGFPIYPKNYDGTYQGDITLHTALSNSLNVPTVKVLEYIGLNSFYEFLLESLLFEPINNIDSYAYGIALGGLEMDLLTLSHYFSIFPNEGQLLPLTIEKGSVYKTPQSNIISTLPVFEKQYTDLVTKILADRDSGVAQFGLKSNLNVPYHSYAVKTGTSRDFHDSWTIGYTPDFVVSVWLGNAENKPLIRLSGQSGAGSVWKRAMDIALNSKYCSDTSFDYSTLAEYETSNSISYGLLGDDFESTQTKLIDTALIRKPHDGDVFLFTHDATIQLVGNTTLEWTINGTSIGRSEEVAWQPIQAGTYTITAKSDNGDQETVIVSFVDSELP